MTKGGSSPGSTGSGSSTQSSPQPARPRFLTRPRSADEAAEAVVTTTKEAREKLAPSDVEKLHCRAIEGLTPKFQLTSVDAGDKQLEVTYSLAMHVNDLKHRLVQYDIIDTFQVITPNTADPNSPLAVDDLLDKYAELSLDRVQKHVRFLRFYGQKYDKQNLAWSQELLENSCEPMLREKVLEQTLGIDPLEMGGPTYFAIMMKVITTMSEEGVRAMIDKIRLMKISDIQGENVAQAVSLLRGAIARLKNLNKLPQDILKQLITIFQTTSVEKFNRLFEAVDSSMRLGVGSFDVDGVLDLAEGTYREFLERREWTSVDKAGSTFFSANQNNKGKGKGKKKQENPERTCWNCGEKGHVSSNCPKPKKNNHNQENKQKGNDPQGQGSDWKTVPPGPREPHRKEKNGKTWYWCSHPGCGGRWNTTHNTGNHRVGAGKGRGQQQQQQQNQANTAETNRPSGNPSAPENEGSGGYYAAPRVSFGNSVSDAVNYVHRMSS